MASVQFNPAICERRKEKDIMKLLMSDYQVSPSKDSKHDFWVIFNGPKESPYEGGTWNVHVILPDQYPYKSPSIGFGNKIFHPNVDETSGTVCLDVINQTWSPMFDLQNVFDVFLPQLLLYANPADPLNPEAAALMLKEPTQYVTKVKEYIRKYASSNTKEEESYEPAKPYGKEERKISNASTKIDEDEMDEENEDDFDDELSRMSEISELSKTSEIDLLEDC